MKGNEKKTDIITMLGAALLTGGLFFLIFFAAGRFPGQKHLFLDGDYYYEFLPMIKMFLRHLFEGRSLAYSFEQSLGSYTAETYGGVCLSPFNLLFLLFGDMDTGACAVVMAKLMAAAAAFAFLLRRTIRVSPQIGIGFAAAYALCGFSINFYTDVMFLDGLYMLPLLVWAIRRFVHSGRWGAVSLMYAYVFITQAYIGYIVGFFTALLFLLCCAERYGKDRAAWIRGLLKYTFSVIVAVLLSAFVIVPLAYGLYTYVPSDNTTFQGLEFQFWELPGIFFAGESQGIYNTHPMAYAGLPVLLLVPAFFLDKTIEKRRKIPAAIVLGCLTVCTVWGPAYLFMHGFDNPDGCCFRFVWFWAFSLLYIAAYRLEKGEEGEKKKAWLITAGIWILLYAILCALQGVRMDSKRTLTVLLLECNGLFLIVYALILYRMKKGVRRNMILAGVLSVELVANGYFCLTPDATDVQRMREYYELWQAQAKDSFAQIDAMEQQDPWAFYRIHYHNASMGNLSMMYGYHGLGGFASQGNEDLRRVLMHLGYATSVKLVADYGSTPLMRMLLAQKYSVYAGNTKVGDIREYHVEKHEETLPLGYMVSPQLLSYSADRDSAFENQNRLAAAMTGTEACPYQPYEGRITVETEGMEVAETDCGVRLLYTGDGETVGSAHYRIFPEDEREMYAFFSTGGRSFMDFSSPTLFSTKDVGIPDHVPYLLMTRILPVGEEEDGAASVVIYMQADGYPEVTYTNQYFASEDPEVLSTIYRELKDHVYQIGEFSETRICGTVNVEGDKTLLFTSIPYDPCWHVYVDGEEKKVINVIDGAFCALQLEGGKHEVVWEYDVPWFRTGWLLSLLGLTVLLSSATIEVVYIKRKKQQSEHE